MSKKRPLLSTAFHLQVYPDNPGHQLHRIEKSKDARFWSVRVGRDLRLIVHKTADSLLLCYADHHDAAYLWAERRRLETHPKTGAAQLVEVRERVEDVVVPRYVSEERPAPPPRRAFEYISDGELLAYGVPQEWLANAREATEETLLDPFAHLPAEAAEALLNLAIGIKPPRAEVAGAGSNPFEHPDVLRRFRVMRNVEELALARARLPSEKVRGVFASGAASAGREALRRGGQGRWLGGNRHDAARRSSSRLPGAY